MPKDYFSEEIDNASPAAVETPQKDFFSEEVDKKDPDKQMSTMLESKLKTEQLQKENASRQQFMQQHQQQQEAQRKANDPTGMTHDQAKQYFKEHPAQNPQQEAQNQALLMTKKIQRDKAAQAIVDKSGVNYDFKDPSTWAQGDAPLEKARLTALGGIEEGLAGVSKIADVYTKNIAKYLKLDPNDRMGYQHIFQYVQDALMKEGEKNMDKGLTDRGLDKGFFRKVVANVGKDLGMFAPAIVATPALGAFTLPVMGAIAGGVQGDDLSAGGAVKGAVQGGLMAAGFKALGVLPKAMQTAIAAGAGAIATSGDAADKTAGAISWGGMQMLGGSDRENRMMSSLRKKVGEAGLQPDTSEILRNTKPAGKVSDVPEFFHTEDATAYGESIRGNSAQIFKLVMQRARELKEIKPPVAGMTQEEENLGYKQSQKSALTREAIEAATNSGSYKGYNDSMARMKAEEQASGKSNLQKLQESILKQVNPQAEAADKARTDSKVDLQTLSDTLGKMPKSAGLNQRLSVASVVKPFQGALGFAKRGLQGMKNIGMAVNDWYFNEHVKWTDSDKLIGEYLGSQTVYDRKVGEFSKNILKTLSNDRQIAITNWISAGGDNAKLAGWAEKSGKRFKKGYEDAQNLTPEELDFANQVKQYYSDRLDEAIKAGVLDHGLENYINVMWAKPSIFSNRAAKTFWAQLNSGMLAANPSFAKAKVFEGYFEGEQAGWEPKDKRVGYALAKYQSAMDEALASRKMIKDMFNAKAKDGRPLVAVPGVGTQIKGDPETATPWLIKPTARPEDTGDYLSINRAALKKWKWLGKDAGGNNIIMQGDLLVHPELAHRLKNLLSKSAIRDNIVGRAVLGAGREVKGTIMSLSLFHQAQEGFHGLSHAVNSFDVPKVDITNPKTLALINHGMTLFDDHGLGEWGDGVVGAGLIDKIPGLGEYNHKYQDWLFKHYISGLKDLMGRQALDNNIARYPKLNFDQVCKLTAEQANQAFGGINWRMMGLHPTTIDALRIGLLAPDFLAARLGFVGQALRPYGMEQRIALLRQATMLFVGARVINYLADPDKHDMHWDKPFSVVIGGREYTMRSVIGDTVHLCTDPRSFVYHRLSPAISSLGEIATGRNVRSRKVDTVTALKDVGRRLPPIPLQFFFNKKDQTFMNGLLQMVGITSFEARTGAQQQIMDTKSDHVGTGMVSEENSSRYYEKMKIEREYRNTRDSSFLLNALTENKINKAEFRQIKEDSKLSDLERDTNNFSIEEMDKVIAKANPLEREALEKIRNKKVKSAIRRGRINASDTSALEDLR